MPMGDLARSDEYGFDPMTGLPIGGAVADPKVTDYGQDLTPFAMGAVAQQRDYRPTDARGTDLWGHQAGHAGMITPQDIDRATNVAMAASGGGLHTRLTAPELALGSKPQGTFKNWLLRYNPETGTPDLVNKSGDTGHAFSTLKTGAAPKDLSFQIANDPGYTLPPLDIATLQQQKAELVFGPTDRVRGGGELTHVGGQQLEKPVAMEGGYNFTPKNAGAEIPGMPKDVDPLYASVTRAAAAKPQKAAMDVLERGGTPYYAPVVMTHGGGDSSKQMANTVHQMVRQSEPSAEAIAKINEAIAAKGGKAPDFADREAFEAWLNTGLPARTAFTKGIDTKEILKATGVDVGQARYANTMPELYHTPSGGAGLMIGRMRPDVGITEHPVHSNYPITFMGQKGEAYRAPGSIPFSLLSPDMHRPMVPLRGPNDTSFASTPAMQVMRGLHKSVPETQKITQEVVDNYYEWFRRHPSGWVAAGGLGMGGLAAQDNYQPEERY